MMRTFFTFTFQVYQTKPYSWLHNLFLYKLWGIYLLLMCYTLTCYISSVIKIIYILSLLVILYSSLCFSISIWQKHDLYLLGLLCSCYLIIYYKAQLSLLPIITIKNTLVVNSSFSSATSNFVPLSIISLTEPNRHLFSCYLYMHTMVYLLSFKILLLTITTEELISLATSNFKLKSSIWGEFQIVIMLAVQSLNLNFYQQREIAKALRNRGVNKILLSWPILSIIKLCLLNNIRKTQLNALILYNRNQSMISTSFLEIETSQFFSHHNISKT